MMLLVRCGGKKGYIALTSSLILMGVLAVIALVLAVTSLLARYNAALFNAKQESRFAAESCFEFARLKLANNSGYSGNENAQVGSSTCSILTVETQGENKLIKTFSIVQKTRTNLKFTVNASTLEKVSVEEVQSF